jgi:hypothetical protein
MGHKKTLFSQSFLQSRDDWIRTSDHQHPMLVRYRTALRPERELKNDLTGQQN